jgi:hypothetical protein
MPNRADPTNPPAHRTTTVIKTSRMVRIRAEVLTVIGLIRTVFWGAGCLELTRARYQTAQGEATRVCRREFLKEVIAPRLSVRAGQTVSLIEERRLESVTAQNLSTSVVFRNRLRRIVAQEKMLAKFDEVLSMLRADYLALNPGLRWCLLLSLPQG